MGTSKPTLEYNEQSQRTSILLTKTSAIFFAILSLSLLLSTPIAVAQNKPDACHDPALYVVKDAKSEAEEGSKPETIPRWEMIKSNPNPLSVRKLGLSFLPLKDADVAILVRKFRNLEDLDLRGTKMSDVGGGAKPKLTKFPSKPKHVRRELAKQAQPKLATEAGISCLQLLSTPPHCSKRTIGSDIAAPADCYQTKKARAWQSANSGSGTYSLT